MEEDDESQSLPSPGGSLSPIPTSPPNDDVTIADVKPPVSSQSPGDALALVVHTPAAIGGVSGSRNGRIGGGGSGGGRDDCWSEEATKVLIDAWGERFSEPGKGTLKQQHWKEVAEIVNKSRQCKYPKTDIQCKNRIDTVKKKYKQEKAKIASGDGPSRWIFFKKLETLIGANTNSKIHNSEGGGRSSDKAPMGTLLNRGSNLYKHQTKGTQVTQPGDAKRSGDSMRWHFRKRSASETESESEPEPSGDSADSLPPQPSLPVPKRVKIDKTGGGAGGSGLGDIAKAILGFTEAYEKAETAKLKQMMELEKERMKFAKEMEMQRMQFLKTQLEIAQSSQDEERSTQEGGERRMLRNNLDDARSMKNNGDVSS